MGLRVWVLPDEDLDEGDADWLQERRVNSPARTRQMSITIIPVRLRFGCSCGSVSATGFSTSKARSATRFPCSRKPERQCSHSTIASTSSSSAANVPLHMGQEKRIILQDTPRDVE